MTVLYWVVGGMLAFLAVTFVRLGLRQRRGVGRAPPYWLQPAAVLVPPSLRGDGAGARSACG